MANEIIGKKERIIVVQINSDTKEERVMYKDRYGGGFLATPTVINAEVFADNESAKKVSDTLNMLYDLLGQSFKCVVVNEVTERNVVEESKEEEEGSQSKSEG